MSFRTVTAARALLLAGAATIAALPQAALAQDQEQAAAEATAEAQAEDQEPEFTGDIVVTARRRNEMLQDVPIAVTAYSGAQLEREGAIDITDIGDTTPNITLETSRGTNSTLTAFIRGVGQQDPVAGFEQGVGIYLDDVYLNRPQGAVLDIYDVERIEILRGPQGTLYGRNTIGGAVKYVTRRLPDEFDLRTRASIGTYGQKDMVVTASTPLVEGFRIGGVDRPPDPQRLRQESHHRTTRITTRTSGRSAAPWRWTRTMPISLRLSGDYTIDRSDPRGGHRLIQSLCDAPCGQPAFPCSTISLTRAAHSTTPSKRFAAAGWPSTANSTSTNASS